MFKESLPSITVTRNPNWSTDILWSETGYVKGKILSLLKRPAWGRLHCWFCLKLLKKIYWFILWLFVWNIPDSGASEYSTTDISNSGVGKYYVGIKINKFKSSFFLFPTLASVNKQIKSIYFFTHTYYFYFYVAK